MYKYHGQGVGTYLLELIILVVALFGLTTIVPLLHIEAVLRLQSVPQQTLFLKFVCDVFIWPVLNDILELSLKFRSF